VNPRSRGALSGPGAILRTRTVPDLSKIREPFSRLVHGLGQQTCVEVKTDSGNVAVLARSQQLSAPRIPGLLAMRNPGA